MADRIINVFCVGLGKQFTGHLTKAFVDLAGCVAIAGLCDCEPARCETVKGELRQAGVIMQDDICLEKSFDRLLGYANDRCAQSKQDSIFVISTPAEQHYEFCRKALLGGFSVYVDKPFVLSSAAGQHLVDLAAQRDLHIVVGAQRRLETVYKSISARVLDVGQIQKMHFHHHGNFPKSDPFERESNVLPVGFGYHSVDTIVWILQSLYKEDFSLRLMGAALRRWQENPEFFKAFDSLFLCETESGAFPITISSSALPPQDTVDELLIITGTSAEIQLRRRAVPRDAVPGRAEFVYWNPKQRIAKKESLNTDADTADRAAPLRQLLRFMIEGNANPMPPTGREALPTIAALESILKNGITV